MVEKLAALANGHRLEVFRALVRAGEAGLAAGAIADRLEMPASSLSFHLSHLKRAGLVTDERKSRSIIYRADYAAMGSLLSYLMEECCADDLCGGATQIAKGN